MDDVLDDTIDGAKNSLEEFTFWTWAPMLQYVLVSLVQQKLLIKSMHVQYALVTQTITLEVPLDKPTHNCT